MCSEERSIEVKECCHPSTPPLRLPVRWQAVAPDPPGREGRGSIANRNPSLPPGGIGGDASSAAEAVHGGAFEFAVGFAFFQVFAFVVLRFAFAHAQSNFDLAVLPIE